jgi:hypothetical protein
MATSRTALVRNASALCGSENAGDNRSRLSPTFFAAAVIVLTWPVTSASIAASP